ncbi:methyltransferase domain-containing protein [Pseudoalteromonas sp. SSDWG2]|uniref:methyltransferase domain-containing protein n=1 Tax=Pseudoalteromonas sp. SSDWG2 TaxID=3139391 RepID=UPI003BA9AB30
MTAALKVKTQSHFSKAASQYQSHAKVQALSSDILLSRIGDSHLGTCLDLGAGPGVNTGVLAAQSDNYIALDLSQQMLTRIDANAHKICADMDMLPVQSNVIDTVFSNFAMQWSDDFASAVEELYRVIKPSGRAYLAVVASNSLVEIKQAFATVGRSAINHFDSMHSMITGAQNVGFEVTWQQQSLLFDCFDTAQEALKSIGAIGASSTQNNQGSLTKSQYIQVLDALQNGSQSVKLSYNVAFMELTK